MADYDVYVILVAHYGEVDMTDFDQLLEQIAVEAEAEGPAGRAHLASLRDRFDLAIQIVDRRRVLHMTQQELAAASGLHQSVVSRIEQGVANPTMRTLSALARALDARLTLICRRG